MNQQVQEEQKYEYIDRYLVDGPLWLGISRGIAMFFGSLCVLEAFRALMTHQVGADFGWIDFSPCPPAAARGLMAFVGVSLMLFGMTHRLPGLIRPSAIVGAMILVAVAVANAVSIHRSIQNGDLPDGIPMPAHVVTLLVPVIFGLVRGKRYGPLRFPTGGLVLLLAAAVSAGGFSLGYVASLSKFHQPQTADAIVIMHPREEAGGLNASRQMNVVEHLVKGGYSGRVMVLNDRQSPVPPLSVGAVQRKLPADTEVRAVEITTPEDLSAVLNSKVRMTIMLIGDRRESAQARLLAQHAGNRVCFISATDEPLDQSVIADVQNLWTTWAAPFRKMLAGSGVQQAMIPPTSAVQP